MERMARSNRRGHVQIAGANYTIDSSQRHSDHVSDQTQGGRNSTGHLSARCTRISAIYAKLRRRDKFVERADRSPGATSQLFSVRVAKCSGRAGRIVTEGQLTICAQNDVGLSSENADVIVGWMHGDEPDNAQPRRDRNGYGPPILPGVIVTEYERIRQRDASRPVLLNLGQGVAFDQYIGRGVRRNHPEDYPEYIKGCDIASFDIYPAVHRNEEVAGKLEFRP